MSEEVRLRERRPDFFILTGIVLLTKERPIIELVAPEFVEGSRCRTLRSEENKRNFNILKTNDDEKTFLFCFCRASLCGLFGR